MGWGDVIPAGRAPIAQLAKGVVPEAGEWLAKQAKLFLDGYWGSEDWCSRYNANIGVWEGQDTPGAVEKTFHMTEYYQRNLGLERFPDDVFVQWNRSDVDEVSGRLLNIWAPRERHNGVNKRPGGLN
jgi:hypothetical protein